MKRTVWRVVRDHKKTPFWTGTRFRQNPCLFYSKEAALRALKRYEQEVIVNRAESTVRFETVILDETIETTQAHDYVQDEDVAIKRHLLSGVTGWEQRDLLKILNRYQKSKFWIECVYMARFGTDLQTATAVKDKLRRFGFKHNKTLMTVIPIGVLRSMHVKNKHEVVILFRDMKDVVTVTIALGKPFWERDIPRQKDIASEAA